MPKSTTIFFCSQCGNEFPKWAGQCPACHEWNTLTEADSFLKPGRTTKSVRDKISPVSITQAISSQKSFTFSTGITELDRVLGPGITFGGVYLLAGQPGIGKSTILTQVALKSPIPVLYICSEENPAQVAIRIQRLTSTKYDHIQLLGSSSVQDAISALGKEKNTLCIVDSIQSVFNEANATTAGSPSQVRDSASLLIQAAKTTGNPLIIVGHVTKEGSIAGPKMLEHMVDAVLDLSGDRQYSLRLLRSIKNRFGPTDETGIFTMDGGGLKEVKDPSEILLDGRIEGAPGSALAMVMEGTRPLTVEIQALIVPTPIPVPRRVAKGVSANRLQLICAILTKHLHLNLSDKDVFVNVTGGIEVRDPSADLAIAMAIISSFKDKALPQKSICFGELGLLGEIRNVPFADKIAKESKALGYTSIFGPKTHHTLRDLKL